MQTDDIDVTETPAAPGGNGTSTLASAVHERLRRDILAGMLEPGTKLRIELVCSRYGAGASPVREALSRLSSEGLVERREQRGFCVAAVSLEDLRDLTHSRCLLEGLALRESIRRRDAQWEEGIVLAFHRLSRVARSIDPKAYRENPQWEALHRAFHRSLIAGCGSRRLITACEELSDQAYRYRQLAVQSVFPKRNEKNEHRDIMDAALAGEAERAVELLCAHYRRTADIIVEHPGGPIARRPVARARAPALRSSRPPR